MTQTSNLFYLVDYEDNSTADITLSMILDPRKAANAYNVGDQVKARYPGMSGTYSGIIVAIDEDRKWLKNVKLLGRPIPAKGSTEVNRIEPVKEKGTLEKEEKKKDKTAEKEKDAEKKTDKTGKKNDKKEKKTDNEKVMSMLEMAKEMPFARDALSESDDDDSDDDSGDEEELELTPKQYQKILELNRKDSMDYLQSLGLDKIRIQASKKPQKQRVKRKLETTSRPVLKRVAKTPTPIIELEGESPSPIPKKKTITLPPMVDLEEPLSPVPEKKSRTMPPIVDLEEMEFASEVNEENPQAAEESCNCSCCPYYNRMKELEILLEQRLPSNLNQQQEVLKPGIYSEEVAAEKKMIPLLPGCNVYLPVQCKSIIFGGSTSRSELAGKLLRAFYSKEEIRSAKSLSHLRDSQQILDAIVACCLRLKADGLKESTPQKIRKALFNVMGYDKRDPQEYQKKRKEQAKKKEKENMTEDEEKEKENPSKF